MAENYNNWSKIADAFDEAQSQVVRKVAFDLQGHMQKQIRANHQIDTGFMINSVYVRTFDDSTYGEGHITAKKITKKMRKKAAASRSGLTSTFATPYGYYLLPEVEKPPDNKTAYVGVGAEYGWWQNYGTHSQPARPFLEPAIEIVRPGFDEALRRIDEKLKSIS